MHQSGHSRAQSMHEVQFSSSSAITPRERGGRCGGASGYSAVWVGRPSVLAVVARPLSRPGRAPPDFCPRAWSLMPLPPPRRR